MQQLASKRSPGIELAWFLVGYIIVLAFLFLLTRTSSFASNPSVLAWAILLDLAITVPLVFAIFIRNTWVPWLSIATLAVLGVVLASLIVPQEHRATIVAIRFWLIAAVETGVLAFIFVMAHRAVGELKSIKGFDRPHAIQDAVSRLVGTNRFASIVAAEATMLFYFFRWPANQQRQLERIEAPADAEVFTYDRSSGIKAMSLAFLMAVAIELVAVHCLIAMWSIWLAWLASLSSVYVGLMIVAQVRAISCRPIFVHDGQLRITNGMFKLVDIPVQLIDRVEPLTATGEPKNGIESEPLNCSLPASPNVAVYLHEPLEAELLYGKTQRFELAYLFVDDQQRFLDLLRNISQ